MVVPLSARGAEYLERVRAVAPLIDAHAHENDALRDLPEPVFAALVEHDLFRLLQPREFGGAELKPSDFVQLLEAVAKHDASTGWCLGQNNVCGTVAAYLEPDAVREILSGPRDLIAWGPGPAQARVEPGGFRLTGRFSFASGSRHATWLGANVPVLEADGKKRVWPDGSAAAYSLLFPRAAAVVEDTWDVIGLKGTGSDSYTVTDLFIPDHHAVPRGGPHRPRVEGRLYAFTPSTLYASGFGMVALGIARAVLDAFIAEARDTTPRGAPRPRGDNNVVQSTVGQAEARLRSARGFVLGNLDECWHAVADTRALTGDQLLAIRLAGTWASQQARETVAQLYLAAGAMSIFANRPFERRFRDIHTLTQQIQGHAAHFETVGQILMGMKPDRPMFTF